MNTAQTILFSTLILAVSSQTKLETGPHSPTSAQCEIVGLCHVSSEFSHFTF